MAPDTGTENPNKSSEVTDTGTQTLLEETQRELREGVDSKLEEKERKDPTVLALESIDSDKPLNEQKEVLINLDVVLNEVLLKALKAGEDPEVLRKSPLSIQKYAKSSTEKLALSKFDALLKSQPEPAIAWWKEKFEEAEEQYADAVEEKENTEKDKPSDKTQWMSSTVKWGLIAAGAVGGAYFLYKWLKGEGAEKKASDLVIGGALAALGVGTLLGSETLGKWAADYLDIDVSEEAIADLMSGKGVKSLNFSSREPGIKKAAKELNITERTLIDLKDVKWGDFSSLRTDLTRTGRSYIHSVLEAAGMENMPGVSFDEDTALAREEVKLESFIKRHEDKIDGDINKMSIGDILNQLEAKGVFGKPSKKPKTTPDGAEETDGTEGSEEVEVGEDLSRTPTVAGVVEGLAKGELSWDEALASLKPAADEDEAALGIMDGVLFVAKGAVIVPLSSLGIVVSQAKDMYDWTSGNGSFGEAIWEDDQIYWAGAYATLYAGKAIYTGVKGGNLAFGQVLAQGGKGAVQGVIDSYLFIPKVVIKGLRIQTEASQLLNYSRLTAKEHLPFLSPQERIHVLHEQTAYYGERYSHYQETLEVFESNKAMGKVKSAIYEKWYGKEWLEKMMMKNAEEYLASRKAFFKEMGISDTRLGSNVTLSSVKADKGIQGDLARSADEFLTAHPTSTLPKIAPYRVTNPKYATHAEATAAGLSKPRVSVDQVQRMERLGLNHERITLKLREYGFTQTDLETLLKELESKPDPKKWARDLEVVLFKIKNPRLYAGSVGLAKAAGIIGTIYMLYDFQESKDKWNTAGEDASMLASFALGARAGAAVIPHPIGKVVGGIVVGTVASFGGQAAWDSYGKPTLQKYFPNRQEFFENDIVSGAGTYFSMMTGGLFINNVIYAANNMGIGDGIDEEVDPLAYLMETKFTADPTDITKVLAGEKWTILDDHYMHDLDDLKENGQEALEDAQEERKELEAELKEKEEALPKTTEIDEEETIEIRIEEIKKEIEVLDRNILRYESYIDGSWIDIKKMELIYTQTEMIVPAFEKFKELVIDKYGPEAEVPFTRLMERMQQGREGVKGDDEMTIWQYLCDQSVELGEGEEKLSFADFASFTIATYQNAQFLEKVEQQARGRVPQPGEGQEAPAQP